MIIGCYSLDLYCDNAGCTYNYDDGLIGPGSRYMPSQFTGSRKGTCVAEARKVGWKMDPRRGKALCPNCVAKGVKLNTIAD